MSQPTTSMSDDTFEPRERGPMDPTPEEIRERSAEIRKGWSKRVAERRHVWPEPSWRPPLVMTIELIRQMSETNE